MTGAEWDDYRHDAARARPCAHGVPGGWFERPDDRGPACFPCRSGREPRESLTVGDPEQAPTSTTPGRAVAALLAHRRTHPAPDHLTDRGERWWRH
jgi:hypothetical protein